MRGSAFWPREIQNKHTFPGKTFLPSGIPLVLDSTTTTIFCVQNEEEGKQIFQTLSLKENIKGKLAQFQFFEHCPTCVMEPYFRKQPFIEENLQQIVGMQPAIFKRPKI